MSLIPSQNLWQNLPVDVRNAVANEVCQILMEEIVDARIDQDSNDAPEPTSNRIPCASQIPSRFERTAKVPSISAALKERLLELGWKPSQVEIVDGDQGISARHAEGRESFQKLVADVGLGKIGIIVGYEVSRLARNCADWHRLLELCGLSDTLIGDSDGVYSPRDFNDRLLLGLKGTMSEAELHSLRLRLCAGRMSKASAASWFIICRLVISAPR